MANASSLSGSCGVFRCFGVSPEFNAEAVTNVAPGICFHPFILLTSRVGFTASVTARRGYFQPFSVFLFLFFFLLSNHKKTMLK